MMNSKVRIVPVAAVCDRRRTDPKNPTGCLSVAAFVRKPQIKPVTQTLRFPRQSSLIKPNQAISCLNSLHSQPPSCSKIPTSPILLRQRQLAAPKRSEGGSNPVKVFSNRYRRATVPAPIALHCGPSGQTLNQLCFSTCGRCQYHCHPQFPSNRPVLSVLFVLFRKSAIPNPQSAIAVNPQLAAPEQREGGSNLF
jgi:hypothetical protein